MRNAPVPAPQRPLTSEAKTSWAAKVASFLIPPSTAFSAPSQSRGSSSASSPPPVGSPLPAASPSLDAEIPLLNPRRAPKSSTGGSSFDRRAGCKGLFDFSRCFCVFHYACSAAPGAPPGGWYSDFPAQAGFLCISINTGSPTSSP